MNSNQKKVKKMMRFVAGDLISDNTSRTLQRVRGKTVERQKMKKKKKKEPIGMSWKRVLRKVCQSLNPADDCRG